MHYYFGPILLNAFLNDFFYTTDKTSVHNFEDDNTLSVFAKTIHELVHSLKLVPETAIKWFSDHSLRRLETDLDNQLSFNLHIRKIGKCTSHQLDTSIRIKGFLGFGEKTLWLIVLCSQTDYCLLVCFIASAKSH